MWARTAAARRYCKEYIVVSPEKMAHVPDSLKDEDAISLFKAMGYGDIIAIDHHTGRLELAKKYNGFITSS